MARYGQPAAPASDIAFTAAVKGEQVARGSRDLYARMEAQGGWETTVTDRLRAMLAETRSAFLATANTDRQPYIQHRGGPPGFIMALDDARLAWADYGGNRQYVSMGNVSENAKAQLFLIDYARRRRIKVWGTLRFDENDAELQARVTPSEVEAGNYRALVERVAVFDVAAWDVNCPQHIPQRFEAADVEAALAARDTRIAVLEVEIAALRQRGLDGEKPHRHG